jgi:hypothetical protein
MIRKLNGGGLRAELAAVTLCGWLAACAPAQGTASPPANSPPIQTATATATLTLTSTATATDVATETPTATPTPTNPLMIEVMRQQSYPGSPLTFEQTLLPGANYNQFVVSYLSEGNKIYALMTIPQGGPPPTGWPVIIFNHGYIPPAQYRTTERYVAYVDAIARHGYIVFKSDYRGHGSSEGEATGGYSSPADTPTPIQIASVCGGTRWADRSRCAPWSSPTTSRPASSGREWLHRTPISSRTGGAAPKVRPPAHPIRHSPRADAGVTT